MNKRNHPGYPAAVVLIILLLMSAGCTSIPGPEPRTVPITASPTPTEIVTINTMRVMTTPVPMGLPTLAPAAVPSKEVPATPSPLKAADESRGCAQQGGGIARPGQQCPGTWLIASDTFNCCSAVPVREISRNTSVTIEPFDLVIVIDDDSGSILP